MRLMVEPLSVVPDVVSVFVIDELQMIEIDRYERERQLAGRGSNGQPRQTPGGVTSIGDGAALASGIVSSPRPAWS